jgi:hypothetical protein
MVDLRDMELGGPLHEAQAPAKKRPSPERAKIEMLFTWAIDLLIVGVMAVGNEYLNHFLAQNAPEGMHEMEIRTIRVFCEVATLTTCGLIVVYDIWTFAKELWGGKAE